ncbi:hypothetical protein AAFC00_003950 [Neodothiora populina]|uniref:Uncharacterized protein n=1 Tax=Neodothiora populina TaxID=2781224 RepID=A0ABR3PJ62_9PEZI
METRADAGRSLSLMVASGIFIYHALTAYLCTYLPSDPLYVAVSISGYAWYGCVLSFLGVMGSINRSSTLLTIFSNHLLIDTVLSLVPKIGVLFLFHDLTSDLCLTQISASFWLPSEESSLHGPGVATPNNEQWMETMKMRHNCELGISVARMILLAMLVLWTTAQWGLGLYIRRYAVRLEVRGRNVEGASCGHDVEKAFYEEDSLADGYRDAVKAVSQWRTSWNTTGGSEKSPAVVVVVSEDKKNEKA